MNCSVDGCDKSVVAHGYCGRHYRRWRDHGDPLGGRRPNVPRSVTCSVSGCIKSPSSFGMCSAHYSRLASHGDPVAGAAFRQKPPADGRCTIEGCGRKHYRRGYCAPHNQRWQTYGDATAGPRVKALRPAGMSAEETFRYFMPGKPPRTLCWEWAAKTGPNGYGILTQGNRGIAAHRFSYELHVGPIPDGMMVLHSCDNRRCVNPRHLRVGTHAENMDDRQVRLRTPTGAKLPQTKLDEHKVREIRQLSRDGFSHAKIAARFDVSRRAIQAVLSRQSWKHVID